MESINLNNYEAYFLDYLEGTLSTLDEAAMYAFLDTHPDLKSEFVEITGTSLSDIALKADAPSNFSSEGLKADPNVLSSMTVDQWMVSSVENDLSADQNVELLRYIAQHKLESKFVAYQATILVPQSTDVSASFSRESLKADPNVLSLMTVDQWMVSLVENDLSADQNSELLRYIAQHKLESKLAAYRATILSPQIADVYGNKSNLKRKPAAVIPMWMKYSSVAAAVALLVFFLNPSSGETGLAEVNSSVIGTNQVSLIRNLDVSNPRTIDLNSNNSVEYEELINDQFEKELFVEKGEIIKSDSAKIVTPNNEFQDNIVEKPDMDSLNMNTVVPQLELKDDDIAVIENANSNTTVEEEPYIIITKAASNVTNRNVSFTRTLNTESDEYIAYHVKIGRFEFDRKKRSK